MDTKTHRQRGFSLIELLVTLTILVILGAIAGPAMRNFIVNNRLVAAANDMMTGVALARSEAIRRGTSITLCKSSDGSSCATSGTWAQGWIIFVDKDGDATVDTGTNADTVLRIQNAIPADLTITGSTDVANYILFQSTAFPKKTNGAAIIQSTLTVCTPGFVARVLTITPTGRASVSTGSTCS